MAGPSTIAILDRIVHNSHRINLTALIAALRTRPYFDLKVLFRAQGKLPAVKLGREYRFRLEDVEEFESKGGVDTA